MSSWRMRRPLLGTSRLGITRSSAGFRAFISMYGWVPTAWSADVRRWVRTCRRSCGRLGYRVSAVALTGETEAALEQCVDRIHWISLGQLGKLIKAFKRDGVGQAVMVGGVKKTHLFANVRPDFRALALMRRLTVRKDDMMWRALAAEWEEEGIRIRESSYGLEGSEEEERLV